PFITEELWQNIRQQDEEDSICIREYPEIGEIDRQLLADFEILFELVSAIRNLRNAKGISPKIALPLAIRTDKTELYTRLEPLIRKLAHIGEFYYASERLEGVSFLVKSDEFFIDLA